MKGNARVVVIAAALLVACSDDGGVSVFDGGPRPNRDGGPALDATPGVDGAIPAPDAGDLSDVLAPPPLPPSDSGPVDSDLGPPAVDAGPPPPPPPPVDAGPSCVGEPTCGLVPQCGCAGAQMCDVDDLRTGARHCIAAGSSGELAGCSAGSCAPGLRCIGDGVDALCTRYCASDVDCGLGSECVSLAYGDTEGLHATPGARICTVACDPVAQTGCPPGYACSIGYSLKDGAVVGSAGCLSSGAQPPYASCSSASRCAPGSMCVSTGAALRCEPICNVASPATCPAPTTCNPPATPLVIRGVSYGLCS